MPLNCVIVSIGDELVLGQTLDTNAVWLCEQLAAIGCPVLWHMTVPDDQPAIERAIRQAAIHADILVITGGLGPTEDDLTRQALSEVLAAPLQLNAAWLSQLEAYFRLRNRPMVPANRIQAMLPRGVEMIENTCGTACGMAGRIGGCDFYVLPGVPGEMKAMFSRDVLPRLNMRSNGGVILSRTLHTFGLGESNVGERLGELMARGRNPSVGTTVSDGIVSVRINARFSSLDAAREALAETEALCRQRLGSLIYGADATTLAEVVAQQLVERRLKVATAESCTGGLLAGMFTDIPGASAYFLQGHVTYTNAAKVQLLGVSPQTIERHGAVSEPTVKEMAAAAQRLSGADYALAISGIAGPGGGTAEKPVGTVCFGLAHPHGVTTRTIIQIGDRAAVRDRACKTALTLLRYHLMGESLPF